MLGCWTPPCQTRLKCAQVAKGTGMCRTLYPRRCPAPTAQGKQANLSCFTTHAEHFKQESQYQGFHTAGTICKHATLVCLLFGGFTFGGPFIVRGGRRLSLRHSYLNHNLELPLEFQMDRNVRMTEPPILTCDISRYNGHQTIPVHYVEPSSGLKNNLSIARGWCSRVFRCPHDATMPAKEPPRAGPITRPSEKRLPRIAKPLAWKLGFADSFADLSCSCQ